MVGFKSKIKSFSKRKLKVVKFKVSKKGIKKSFSFTEREKEKIRQLKKRIPKPNVAKIKRKLKVRGKNIDFRRLF